MSRQSSLAEDRINSSDEDEFLEERSGTFQRSSKSTSRPFSYPVAAACYLSFSMISIFSTENDLEHLFIYSIYKDLLGNVRLIACRYSELYISEKRPEILNFHDNEKVIKIEKEL